jgi:hypothetical protein
MRLRSFKIRALTGIATITGGLIIASLGPLALWLTMFPDVSPERLERDFPQAMDAIGRIGDYTLVMFVAGLGISLVGTCYLALVTMRHGFGSCRRAHESPTA